MALNETGTPQADAVVTGAITSKPLDEFSILTVIGAVPGSAGPWTFVTDVPASDRDMIGPPAHYFALAGWGSCTAVTVTGVAHRGNIPLDGIDIDFQLERVATPGSAGFGVRKKLILKGQLSETEIVRLRRAANYCPVDQLFTKGALEVEDHIEWASGDKQVLNLKNDEPLSLASDPPSVAPGQVQSRYLADTKVQAEDGLYEGEVKSYLACDNLSRPGRWIALAGHSHDRWVPAPVPLSHGALAASTVATLRRRLVQEGLPFEGLRVEIGTRRAGDRNQSQANAAAGRIRYRQALRRVVVPGSPATLPLDVVRAALRDDPLSRAVRHGGILLSEEVVVI